MNKLPAGWWEYKFGDLTILSQYGLSCASSSDGETPMLRMNNILDGKLITSNLVYVSLSPKALKVFRLNKGDLLFNRTNSYDLIGKTALFDREDDFVCASYLIRFTLDQSKVIPSFVNYFFNTEKSRTYLRKLATQGVSQSNINPTTLKRRFVLIIPPLSEQKQIVTILSSWDTAIEQTAKLIAAKVQLKKGLMQQLLTGKKRFHKFVRDEGKFKTKFGEFPSDWVYLRIKDIAREVLAKNKKGKPLTVLSCTKYKGLVDSLSYFGKQIFSVDTSTYKIVKRGQFAYATNHIEEGSIGYQDLYDEALISPMYTVFETDVQVNHSFFYKLLKTETYRHIFEVNTSGSIDRRGALRWKDFANIKVALPSLEEQQRIAAVLEVCEKEIELLVKQRNALKEQKRGLMQQLLTGKIRVQTEVEV